MNIEQCIDDVLQAQALRKPHHRLGFDFEDVFGALLRAHPFVTQLQQNIRGLQGSELDYIVHTDNPSFAHNVFHIEAAVKFYLCLEHGGSVDAQHFVGPHNHDTFARKWERMQTLQLQPQWEKFPSLLFDVPPPSYLCIKGMLFFPLQNVASWTWAMCHTYLQQCTLPAFVRETCLRGLWVNTQILKERFDPACMILRGPYPKKLWISEDVQELDIVDVDTLVCSTIATRYILEWKNEGSIQMLPLFVV